MRGSQRFGGFWRSGLGGFPGGGCLPNVLACQLAARQPAIRMSSSPARQSIMTSKIAELLHGMTSRRHIRQALRAHNQDEPATAAGCLKNRLESLAPAVLVE